MGITREGLVHLCNLSRNKEIDFKDCNVIELGAQTVHFEDRGFFRRLCEIVGLDPTIAQDFHHNMSGYYMHQQFGHKYQCIDLDEFEGKFPVLKWDLNEIKCPEEHKGVYDLCTNYGTTEHLFNQTNAFKLIHDLLKVGGVVIHILPMAEVNHGLFNYSPVLFQSLAKYNNYKLLGMYTTSNLSSSNMDSTHLVPYNGQIFPDKKFVHAILKKTTDEEFVNPSQIFDSGFWNYGV